MEKPTAVAIVSLVMLPRMSILADVVIGRYKLVSYSLKAIWITSIVGSVISICEGSLSVAKSKLFIIQFLVVVIPHYVVLGVFMAVAVPLAMDQINGGSNANTTAVIQWLVWVFFSGIGIPFVLGSIFYNCTNLQSNEVNMIMSLLPVLLLSVGLILDFYFHQKLVKEPVTVNPVSLIFKVLKYAAKHKYPVQRSAFTYCENERPTRLDYGKSKYGGPFTTEQVEDVKTFWRVTVVIIVISLFTLLMMALLQSESNQGNFGIRSNADCTYQNVLQTVSAPSLIITYSIPLYELLVYPCLRNRGPSILQSAGIGAAAVIFSSLYGIIKESIRQNLKNGTNCMFEIKNPNKSILELIFGILFNIIIGYTMLVPTKSSIKFVCAQAPYSMRGLLLGLYFTVILLSVLIGAAFYLAWSFYVPHTSTCGIWFYLTTLVLAVVSSALLGLVTRWYKARERDEIVSSQALVEEVYHKYHEQTPGE